MTPAEFYKKLDDEDFARKYFNEQLELVKDMLFEITGVTSGVNVVVEGHDEEWAHAYFLYIFDILMIRHKNFFLPDFLEKLQDWLFNLSVSQNEANLKWQRDKYAYLERDENGFKVEQKAETVLDLSAHPESVQKLNKQETEKLIEKHNLPEEVSNVLRACSEVNQ